MKLPSLSGLDPRRSLGAGVMWLVIALAAVFSTTATLWVGSIARSSVIAQHQRRLSLETDQLSSALSQAITERLGAIRVSETLLYSASAHPHDALSALIAELRTTYPQLEWLDVAQETDLQVPVIGSDEARSTTRSSGLGTDTTGSLGVMSAPVHAADGRVIGIIRTRLSWLRTEHHPPRLTDDVDGFGNAAAYLLDGEGHVLVGPRTGPPAGGGNVMAAEAVSLPPGYPQVHWFVQLSESRQQAYRRADLLVMRILGASSLLAALTALLGIVGARQLTRRLRRLTDSVNAAQQRALESIDVPTRQDEVAQLGAAFAALLQELQGERRELERRVGVRTREVERLADDARYAAIVRERLKIARDLHDTLAHSMMAMLSEIRYLRRMQTHDPQALAAELANAEQLAHAGLEEARNAITQMRTSTVRETGLGEALTREVERFVDRTSITADASIDTEAARFADARAVTLLRIAQEAIRNVEQHAMATAMKVTLNVVEGRALRLQIEDDGVGFDPALDKPGHYGLLGLREQAALIGATLQIDSAPAGGTRLCVELPLAPVEFN